MHDSHSLTHLLTHSLTHSLAHSSVEDELGHIRSQLDRIEHIVSRPLGHGRQTSVSGVAQSPFTAPAATPAASPSAAHEFPYMKIQTSTFTQMAGLGDDYGNLMIRLEQEAAPTATVSTSMFVLQHTKVLSALQSFSASIHPWYPILEDRFSDCIARFMTNAFKRGTDTFLVLMVLASGTIAQQASHAAALEERPDTMYLQAAMDMLNLVVLEQSLRSVQCLVAASIHYYLLLKPIQAHDLVLLAIKKAQNLHMSGAMHLPPKDGAALEQHWLRLYRIALLIEAELVIPLRLADSNAWETEDSIALPTGTDIWSFDSDAALFPADSPATTRSVPSDDVITYLLAEIAMRRMLRRNTTAISVSRTKDNDAEYEYAPLVAKELETQLEQWFGFLPEPLRFSREFEGMHTDDSLQTPFLRTQYWACMVSFYWPAVVRVMEVQSVTETAANGCRLYFKSFREFVRSAVGALDSCWPNKWTIYARSGCNPNTCSHSCANRSSIFAISLGAYMGASTPVLASFAAPDIWDTLELARDAFGPDCNSSPSLALMAESMRATLGGIRERRMSD